MMPSDALARCYRNKFRFENSTKLFIEISQITSDLICEIRKVLYLGNWATNLLNYQTASAFEYCWLSAYSFEVLCKRAWYDIRTKRKILLDQETA